MTFLRYVCVLEGVNNRLVAQNKKGLVFPSYIKEIKIWGKECKTEKNRGRRSPLFILSFDFLSGILSHSPYLTELNSDLIFFNRVSCYD